MKINKETKEIIDAFYDLLVENNKSFNITRIIDYEDFWHDHVLDSIEPFKHKLTINKKASIIDIGTGGGFPGVILAIVFPWIAITLVEANTKKVNFLNKVKTKLRLDNITVINKRAEELDQLHREYYDYATARALASLDILFELLSPYVKVNGNLIIYKGPRYKEEIDFVGDLYKEYSLEEGERFFYKINEKFRVALFYKKYSSTKKIYPRNYAKIKKDNLKLR